MRLEAAGRDPDDPPQDPEVDPFAVALIGHRRVGETGAHDHPSGGEGRADDPGDVLRARGVEEERVGDGVDLFVIGRHQELVEPVAEVRSAGLARQKDVEAALGELVRQAARLERLAGPVGAFDRDETAGRTIVCGHDPSVADGPLGPCPGPSETGHGPPRRSRVPSLPCAPRPPSGARSWRA